MNAIANSASAAPVEVSFGNGNRALLVLDSDADPGELLAALGLLPRAGRPGVIVVCGGADGLRDAARSRAEAMLGPAVSAASQVAGAAVFDGGTAAGVMAMMGAARGKWPTAIPVLVGVAPAGLVSYPDGPADSGTPLEENHSHFALARSSEWGGETALLMDLAAACAGNGRVVTVLAGGGQVTKAEALESARRGWPLFIIQGTGGVADAILQCWDTYRVPHRRRAARLLPARLRDRKPAALSMIEDADLREIMTAGDVRPVTGADPGQLSRRIAWELQDEPVLKDAWQQFATYDQLATRLRAAFTWLQASILLLGVLATLLALIQAQTGNRALHWTVVVLPILASVLIAFLGRRAVGQRWVMLRAAAEAIKAEIYRHRALAAGREHEAGQQELAARLDAIEARLIQTEASSGPLTPYDGPLPPAMYGAGSDDDGLSPLDAERYLAIRIGDQLTYFHGRVRTLNRRRNILQLTAITVGATGAILAAAGLDVWLGLTSGAAAAALAYLSYLQIDNTLVTFNQAAIKLGGLEREWRARAAAQRGTAAFNDLVARSETVLTSEYAGWVQQMSETLQELKDRQSEVARALEPRADQPAGGRPGPA